MILASGHGCFRGAGSSPVSCRIMGEHTANHATTTPRHSPAASRARVANICTAGRPDSRVDEPLAGHQNPAPSPPEGQRTSWADRRRLLVPAGQLQCGGRQIAPTGARFSGPFGTEGPERHIDSHQSAKSGCLARFGSHFERITPAKIPKKKALILDQGLFRFVVPLVGFASTSQCSTLNSI